MSRIDKALAFSMLEGLTDLFGIEVLDKIPKTIDYTREAVVAELLEKTVRTLLVPLVSMDDGLRAFDEAAAELKELSEDLTRGL